MGVGLSFRYLFTLLHALISVICFARVRFISIGVFVNTPSLLELLVHNPPSIYIHDLRANVLLILLLW